MRDCPSLRCLIAVRCVQGAAAAVMMPASMALIGQAYPDPVRRARAVATWAMGAGVASTAGPVLGGVLTAVNWRLIFLVNVPVSGAALFLLRNAGSSPRHAAPVDWVGQGTGAVAIASLTFGVIEAGSRGLGDRTVVTAMVLAVVAIPAFVLSQWLVRHPMVPGDLFRSPTIGAAMVIGFAFMVGYYGLPFVMSLMLQQQRGLSAFETGLVFVPMMLVGLVLTPIVPSVSRRVGIERVVVFGLMLMTTGLAIMALIPSTTPAIVIAGLMLVVGLGGPMVAPPVMTLLLGATPVHRAGIASGVFNTSRQIGGALAIALFGALLGSAGFNTGRSASLLIAAAATALAALIGALSLGPREGLAATGES